MSGSCKTCKYYDPANMLVRCILCRPEMKDWEPKDRNQTAHCETCRYEEKSAYMEPCISCGIAWPGSSSHWEPKEETKEEDMGDKTFTMTFTTDKINEETLKTITGETEGEDDLQEKLDEANEKIKDLRDKVDSARLLCAWKNGEIEGLHYAIRHFAKGAKKK